MGRKHLFVAAGGIAWGETLVGRRIALDLHARGDEIVFLAGTQARTVLAGCPFKVGLLPDEGLDLAELILALAGGERFDSVVLVDVTICYIQMRTRRNEAHFAARCPAPLLGLDLWDVGATDLVWDTGPQPYRLSPHTLDVRRRLVPAPIGAPGPGRFDGLPPGDPPTEAERAAARAELGLAPGQRLLLLPSAAWQRKASKMSAYGEQLADGVPELLAAYLGRAGDEVCVLHVGDAPYEAMQALGPRYRFHERVPPARFRAVLAAADALLTLNLAATTIGSAIAHGLPTLLVRSTASGTADDVLGGLPRPPSATATAWLRRWFATGELRPFVVWPYGLSRFLEPVMRGNPYLATLRLAELLDEDDVMAGLDRVLRDEDARAAQRAAQAAYAAEVRRLPGPAALFDQLLAGDGVSPAPGSRA